MMSCIIYKLYYGVKATRLRTHHGIFISQWHFMSYSIEFPPLVLHWCFKCFYLHPMLSYEPPHIGHIYPRPYLVQTWICISQWYFTSKQIAFPIDGSWEDLHNFLLLGDLLALSHKGSTSLVVSLTLLMPRCTRYNTICDKNGQWLATGRWFSLGTPVSSTNKTGRYDITEILLKVALNTLQIIFMSDSSWV